MRRIFNGVGGGEEVRVAKITRNGVIIAQQTLPLLRLSWFESSCQKMYPIPYILVGPYDWDLFLILLRVVR